MEFFRLHHVPLAVANTNALAAISFLSLSLFVFATAKQNTGEGYTMGVAILGGVGGLSLLGQRCLECGDGDGLLARGLASFVLGSAAVLHFAAFLLGIEAIQFYLTMPEKDWGPTFATHGAWWWIGLMILLCICNLMASVIGLMILYVWLVYRRGCHCQGKRC